MHRYIRSLAMGIGVSMMSAAMPGFAQDYPSRPVRIIVPFAAGGSSDTISRIIAQKLTASVGQTFLVENRPGAGGNIGMDSVAKAAPDGYTLLFAAGSLAVNVSLYSKLPFDPVKDFQPIIHVCSVTGILVVHPSVTATTAAQFIDLARAQPGKLNYASAGSGTVIHLAGAMFNSMAKLDMVHVPYKGSGPALADLLGGQVQAMFANMPGTLQHVRAGKLRVLGVTSENRSPLLPEVPALGELVPGYTASTWFGVLAPAGTPPAVVARLNAEFAKALAAPDVVKHLQSEGAQVTGGSPDWFRDFLKADIERWAPVVRASGAKVN